MPMGQSKGTDSLVQIPSPQSWHLKQTMTGMKCVVESLHLISTVTWQATPIPGQPRTASLASSRFPDPSSSPVSLHHKHKLCHCKGNKGPVTSVTRTILPLPFSFVWVTFSGAFRQWNSCHWIQACALGSQAYLRSLTAIPGPVPAT